MLSTQERRAYQSSPKYHAYKRKVRNRPGYQAKANVHLIVHRAIKKGIIVRQPCEVCGETKVEAHHEDYSKPLDVKWLCRKHHREHHASLKSVAE